jgi:hypothetical protein
MQQKDIKMIKSPKLCVSKAERKRRVHSVFELLVEGTATVAVVKFCMDEWDVAWGTAYHYIRAADKLMAKALAAKREDRISRAIAQREHLIEKLINAGQFAAAIQGLADKDKMIGLYEQPEHESNVTIEINQS